MASKNQKPSQGLWTNRLERRIKAGLTGLIGIARGLRSPDRGTRRMSMLFFASLLSAGVVASIAWRHSRELKRQREEQMSEAERESRHLSSFFEKQAEDARRKVTTLPLGSFTLELTRMSGQRPAPGVRNLAEIDIVVECDSRATCREIEDRMTEVRNQLTNVFTALDREEIMSVAGKQRIKRSLMERVNAWLPDGKVNNVFFSKLIVS